MIRRSLIVAVLVLTAGSAEAFDGNRKGFILGGSLGAAATNIEDGDTKGSLATEFIIGGGISPQVLLYYTNYGTWFSQEGFAGNSFRRNGNRCFTC